MGSRRLKRVWQTRVIENAVGTISGEPAAPANSTLVIPTLYS